MLIKLTFFNLCSLCMKSKKKKKVSHIFLKLFGVSRHAYYNIFSLINLSAPRTFLKTRRFAMSAIGHILYNNCLSENEKEIDNFLLFRQRSKEKKLELSTAANFFQEKDTHLLNYLCQ